MRLEKTENLRLEALNKLHHSPFRLISNVAVFLCLAAMAKASVLNEVVKCKPNCIQCVDETTCIRCDEGYFLQYGQCILCPKGCSLCTNKTVCNECFDGYAIQENTTYCVKTKTSFYTNYYVLFGIAALFFGIVLWQLCKRHFCGHNMKKGRRRGDYVDGEYRPRSISQHENNLKSYFNESAPTLHQNAQSHLETDHPEDMVPSIPLPPVKSHNPVNFTFNPHDPNSSPSILPHVNHTSHLHTSNIQVSQAPNERP